MDCKQVCVASVGAVSRSCDGSDAISRTAFIRGATRVPDLASLGSSRLVGDQVLGIGYCQSTCLIGCRPSIDSGFNRLAPGPDRLSRGMVVDFASSSCSLPPPLENWVGFAGSGRRSLVRWSRACRICPHRERGSENGDSTDMDVARS